MSGHPTPAYDLEAIRAEFPILKVRPYGKPLVYLDNAASAQKPRAVLDRVNHFYEHEYSNVHRGLHYLANAATDAYEAARESVRRFLNAGSVDEIVFTRSATEAINLVASSYGQDHIGAGDEIVLSILEHHANIIPWHFHRERKGAVLKWVDVADDGALSLEAFEAALTSRTKIVAITQMSNVTGTATPIAEIVRIAHGRGIPVLVDGFIVSVAALLAVRLNRSCRPYLLFSHRSAEQGHRLVLDALEARPLLDLDLRLGEGSGAALALPLVRLACALHNRMATFAEAAVPGASGNKP